MKIILLLIFVGALTLTLTATLEEQGCLNVPAKEKFEPKKYFHGRWYLTNFQTALGSGTEVCQNSLSDVLEDGTISHKIYAYSDETISEFVVCNCTSNLRDIKDDLGKVPMHCKVITSCKDLEFDMEGTILETDYDHFALTYVCGKIENKEIGNFLILNRDKDAEPTDQRIADSLKKQGLDLNAFVSRKNVTCKEHPDFVNN